MSKKNRMKLVDHHTEVSTLPIMLQKADQITITGLLLRQQMNQQQSQEIQSDIATIIRELERKYRLPNGSIGRDYLLEPTQLTPRDKGDDEDPLPDKNDGSTLPPPDEQPAEQPKPDVTEQPTEDEQPEG